MTTATPVSSISMHPPSRPPPPARVPEEAPKFIRDLKEYSGTLPTLAAVSIEGLK